MPQRTERPPRTLGLALAIIVSVLLYSVGPLLQVAMVLLVQTRLQRTEFTIPNPEGGDALEAFAVGGNFSGVSDASLLLQAALGVGFLIIAVMAWRGRPPRIRLVLLGAVVALTLYTIALTVIPLLTQPSFQQGIDSGADLRTSLLCGRLGLTVLIPLYVLWYMNRAPARAFYRGYYLPSEQGEADPSQQTG